MLTHHAQVAKRIKVFCKSLGVKCSARSDSFSMGNSVHWEVENISPETFKQINDFANGHQYGHFNGMEDIYEYSNKRDDIPQTKYCSGSNKFTDEFYQKAWDVLKNSASNGDDKPANYEDAKALMWCGNGGWSYEDQISQYVRKILIGSEHAQDYISELSNKFWQGVQQVESQAAPVANGGNVQGVHIEEHMHTKHNFKMFMVIIANRVDSDLFNALRDSCNSLGGWYSRQWGKTPGGFAFKDIDKANNFIQLNFSNETSTPGTSAPTPGNSNLADKLKDTADKMQTAIDDKMRDRETNTPKRLAQAAHARQEGEQLMRTQAALYKLAELHQAGTVPPLLAQFKTKAAIYDLMTSKKELVANGWHQYYACTGVPSKTTPEAAALWTLLQPKTDQEKRTEEVQRKIQSLQFSNIPGYFPTPESLINLMIEKADIQQSDRVLEPSAGNGLICDLVAPLCKEVKAFEINYTLAEILDAKDYLIEKAQDFLSVDPVAVTSYEKILMNPPFEQLQDVDHVLHAFKFLKQGGRMVAIMSPGAFFRSDKKAAGFRIWFDAVGGELLDIPAGAFKQSNTNIATKMVVIDKPAFN